LRTDLLDRHGIGREDQYRVLPYGFNLERLGAITDDDRARARQTLEIPSAAGVVTSVGRLTAIKAHDLFLRVAAIVHRRRSDAVFLIAGDGELRADLEAQAARAGLQNCVRFLGWRRDLPVLYAASDIFLLTSRNEGTPVALIDGMAAACAAVATSVGGVPDVVSSSTVGLLGASGDADALAAHVTALLDNPSRRREMAEAGRRSVLSSFGIERMIDDVEALYGELLASAPASV
jgi:glycosyltransferase involved in cell wall biosynthesis